MQHGETNSCTTSFINKGIPLARSSQTNASQCHSPRLAARGILTYYRIVTNQAAWLEPKYSPEYTIYQS